MYRNNSEQTGVSIDLSAGDGYQWESPTPDLGGEGEEDEDHGGGPRDGLPRAPGRRGLSSHLVLTFILRGT